MLSSKEGESKYEVTLSLHSNTNRGSKTNCNVE